MKDERKDEQETGTLLDPSLARPRLKDSLVPPQTGIFLRVIEGGGIAGRTFTLSAGGTYVIGRDGADVELKDKKVSRKHAEIACYGPDRYFLRDLASTNGTFLNERRVMDRKDLHHEDRIRVGDTMLQFCVIENSIQVPLTD